MSPRSNRPARQHASVETLTPISDARYPVTQEWHALSPAEVAKLLSVNPDEGLSDTEARGRLARVGANVVGEHTETPLWRLALAQFRSLVVLLLLAASVIAAALGERVESVAILAALLLNAGIGFFTEWRARISLAKLRALTVPEALVRREGAIVKIHAAEVVPGDLLVLEAGAHALEIPFVFDTLGSGTETLWGAAPPRQLADKMHAAWVAFAADGDPGWARYEHRSKSTMRFDLVSEVVDDPRSGERALWKGVR